MNISRFIACALLSLALPALAQPDAKPGTELPYPKVTPEDAAKLGLTKEPIVLHLKDVTFDAAISQLSRGFGIPINTIWSGQSDNLKKKVSLELETRSFNEAFAALLKAADVKADLQRFNSSGPYNLTFGEGGYIQSGLPSGTGEFSLRLDSLNSNLNKHVNLSETAPPDRGQSTSLSAFLSVVSNTELPAMALKRIRLTRADDDQGRSLAPEQKQQDMNNVYYGSPLATIGLRSPEADTKSIAHLEGVEVYVLPSKHEIWEVPDALGAKNVSHAFGSNGQTLSATVKDVVRQGNTLTVNFHISGFAVDGDGTVQNPLFHFEQLMAAIQLTDAKGRVLQGGGYGGTSGGNELTINANFILPPSQTPPAMGMDGKPMDAETPTFSGPIKLVFNVPTEFVQTQVPFSFHDLPLP